MQTETTPYIYSNTDQLRLLGIIKSSLQSLVTLYNILGDQAGAHRASVELCSILAQEFQINPQSRRTR